MLPATPISTVVLLIVEDNPADLALTRHALDQAGVPLTILVAGDGEEAMAMLRAAPPPDLILLDLNLPGKNGMEVLAELAEDATLRRIPVVVLSSSTAPKDVQAAYDRNANAYLVKSMDLDEFIEAVQTLRRFWLDFVRLPSGPAVSR
jgi:two-component system, chemotaxis family, response regulator Rcp1